MPEKAGVRLQDTDESAGESSRLTRRGVSVYEGMVPLACELEGQLAEHLSRSEWSTLLKALDKLSAHAEDAEGDEHGLLVC